MSGLATQAETETISSIPAGAPPRAHLPVGESIARGALALLSMQPLTWAASLLTVVVTPRLLGADALGQLAIAITICTLTATTAGLGISEFLVRRAAQRPESLRQDAGIALTIQTVTVYLAALAVALVGWVVPTPTVNYPLLLVALLPVLGAPAQTVLLSSMRGSEHHRNYAWFNAAGVVLSSVCSVIVLLVGGNVVSATATGGALVVLTTLVAWKLSGLRPVLPSLNGKLLIDAREFIRGGFPFLTWQLALTAYGDIDRVLLGVLVPTSEVGWYSAAYRIIGITVFIPTLIMAPLFPVLSRSIHAPETVRRTIAQTLRVLLILMLGLAAGSIVAASAVPDLFGWPAEFEHATPLMMILALHLPLVAIDMVLGVVLMAFHQEGRLAMVGIAAAVFNVAANLVAIPFFEHQSGNGAIGASIVTVLTELFMFGGAVILIPKHLLDPSTLWQAARLTLAAAAAVVVGMAVLRPVQVWLTFLPVAFGAAMLATGLTYLLIAVLFGALARDDARMLLSRFSRSRS